MKNIIFLFLLCSNVIFSQQKNPSYTFNKVTNDELKMDVYEKDPTANAVVLFEHGNTVVENNDKIYLKTTVYKKIKILNKEGEKHATVSILIYNDKNKSKEKVKHIKAITHNLNEPLTFLNDQHIYTNTKNENWKEVTFTFPNVKPGSVLEYQYDLESEFFFNFSGWTFQSDIPKVHSEFHASIPGYWIYNRHLNGLLKLSTNNATLKKNCFEAGNGSHADCEELTYIMKDVPAFVEEENYSTSKNNYISKIKFELSKILYTNGDVKNYTSSWKETDKRLKSDESVGKQLKNDSYFSKNLPKELLSNKNKLDQSKSIYTHIQNHFLLNKDKTYIFRDVDVKKAYKEKLGSVSEINLALIAALNAAKIDAKIFLLSTRDSGYPTKLHPVMTDFNYLVAHITIDDQTFILDASDKYLAFDMLPFKALNSYGRVLDFKNGSYWFSILPKINTYNRVSTLMRMDEEGTLTGKAKETTNGYFAKFKREKIRSNSEASYLSELENENQNLKILAYHNEKIDELNAPLVENFEIEQEAAELIGNKIYLNPFIKKYDKNPFQLEQRNYPVNFGYKFQEQYMASIEIPDNFIIKNVPKNIAYTLPNDGGTYT
ncbi:MAG: DUF3857 domain-containing protein, partial [Flavobacteriaceae bacterium]|nr:DUF3857 domain-containing protein [Flavobacteriaceae bacterium]